MLRVLVVEDNILLADLLGDYLVSQDFEVCGVAQTVDEAVAIANLHKPDIAVFDFRLANGELGPQIKARIDDKNSMAVLYVSGDPLAHRLSAADGEGYIQKPYGMKDLATSLIIVDEVKRNIHVSPARFPKSFRLIEGKKSPQPEAAL